MSLSTKRLLNWTSKNPAVGFGLRGTVNSVARMLGVPEQLITRSGEIVLKEENPLAGMRFIYVFIMAALGKRIPGFPFNISSFCKDDGEREIARNFLIKNLEKQGSALGIDQVNLQITRLAQISDRNSDEVNALVRKAVKNIADDGTAKRKNNAHSEALSKKGREVISELKEIFDANDIRFFLISGTLLGAVREGDFIGCDFDIDLGVFSDETSLSAVRSLLWGNGFSLTLDQEYIVGFTHRSGVNVEFFAVERGDQFYEMYNSKKIVKWRFSPFELEPIQFLGHHLLAPAARELNLQENYGNWQCPTLFFDHIFDVPCAEFLSSPEALFYLSRKLVYSLQIGDRFSAERCINILKKEFELDYTDLLPRD